MYLIKKVFIYILCLKNVSEEANQKFRSHKSTPKDHQEEHVTKGQYGESFSPAPSTSSSSSSSSSSPSSPTLSTGSSSSSLPNNCASSEVKTNLLTINNLNQHNNQQQQQQQTIITQIIKPFLETVHEEEGLNDCSNESGISGSNKNEDSTEKLIRTNDELNSNQLYEQLDQLKPIQSRSFKSSASISINVNEHVPSENPAPPKGKIKSSSVVIKPSRIPALVNSTKSTGVRFNTCIQQEDINSMGSSASCNSSTTNECASDLTGNHQSEHLNKNDYLPGHGTIRMRSDEKQRASSNLIVPRRNSSILTSSNSTNNCAPRRVSLSVTDL